MDSKEASTTPDQWNGFSIKITYPPKINWTANDIKEEFKKRSSVKKLWLKFFNNGEVSQLKFWKEFLMIYAVQFPSFLQLVQKMIGTSPKYFCFWMRLSTVGNYSAYFGTIPLLKNWNSLSLVSMGNPHKESFLLWLSSWILRKISNIYIIRAIRNYVNLILPSCAFLNFWKYQNAKVLYSFQEV